MNSVRPFYETEKRGFQQIKKIHEVSTLEYELPCGGQAGSQSGPLG
ncbi:hypothetical protein C035_02974 [Brucella melitensis R3/07-2]|nr:hypothetical protein DK62_2414 [Brucella melitensis bv. 3 str. Ether]ENQ88165.1 hypothetical protein C061_02823 [Brucella melitensis F5/07-239A]ENQ94037.1 hypothetical protein C035_02974 [Brucella melitensis R3/07-2]ENS85834.1 hypothetical protein B984_02171 [Brucella melitensis UK31/99]ENT70039.1 hypothetical protein D628_02735 [Brucella melitensis F15/06-7]SPU59008.1 Uncharacterised protein [Brucella melitensis]